MHSLCLTFASQTICALLYPDKLINCLYGRSTLPLSSQLASSCVVLSVRKQILAPVLVSLNWSLGSHGCTAACALWCLLQSQCLCFGTNSAMPPRLPAALPGLRVNRTEAQVLETSHCFMERDGHCIRSRSELWWRMSLCRPCTPQKASKRTGRR